MMIRATLLMAFFAFLAHFPTDAQPAPHLPGEFLVSLSEGADGHLLARRFSGVTAAEKVAQLLNIWLLRSDLPEQAVLTWLRQQPEVREAQFNHLLEERNIPNDPLFPQQWQLLNNGLNGGLLDADLDAEKAWDLATGGLTPAGDTIVIAVIDRGLDAAHPDLAHNLWHNWHEIPNNGFDDDGNGYVDDFRGWNVFSQSDHIEGNNTTHGTPVSAILGAEGNNGLGVTGVNWNTRVLFVSAYGSEAFMLAAYDYILKARQRYNETFGGKGAFVVAVNCSWGINYGQPSEAPLWCAAFDKLGESGIVSVAATANLPVNVDEVGDLPTACPSSFLIGVTSLNSSDLKPENAAWGAQHIDLGAYGESVYTAAASNGYGYFSGTSFAAPQVAGAVGLLFSAPCPNLIALAKTNPAAAAYWAKSLILENVSPNVSLLGKTSTDGRLNLFKTIFTYQNQCSSCPAPFALKTEMLTDSSATLLWSRPPAALLVNLRWRRLGIGLWTTFLAVPDTFTLKSLTDCTPFEFETQSVCEGGVLSAWSHPLVFETKGCCTVPASVWLVNGGNEFSEITWEASGLNNEYRLRLRKSGDLSWDYFEADTNFWTFQNLLPCTDYELQVQARCIDWVTDFSPIFSFQTKGCGACNEVEYCAVKALDATEEWIASVQIGLWAHVSGAGGSGYQNFGSGQLTFPQMTSLSTIPVVVSPGFSGGMTKEYFRIYVDFNQDGDFEDDQELAFDPGFALEGLATGFLQVPEFAMPGITRLRVMMKYTTPNDPPPAPCTNFSFGQVEDYCAELLMDSVPTDIPVEDTLLRLRAYPQPAYDWVLLEFPRSIESGDCALTVVDMTGRPLIDRMAPMLRDGLAYLDTSQWPSGVYVARAWCGGTLLQGILMKL